MSSNKKKSAETAANRAIPPLTVDEYVEGVLANDRSVLGRAITLVESQADKHQQIAQEVLSRLNPHGTEAIRLGITGIPGAGKSTFIETLGLHVIEQGYRVAVLAIDPSSSISRGSILGDKTRMNRLAQHWESFVRPSPTSGALGGAGRKTREAIRICEAAGYDAVIVETVGVGQNEVAVRGMVDFLLILQIAGGGDELQGIKKGIIELADAIVVNKADGDNKIAAEAARQEIATALHYLKKSPGEWQPRTATCSALTGEGISEIWQMICEFREETTSAGAFQERRNQQALDWMHALLSDRLLRRFYQNPDVLAAMQEAEASLKKGQTTPESAAEMILKKFSDSDNRR